MTAEVCARFDTAEKFEITMNDPAASLRRKITSAGELESVVRTMKAMSASSIGRYESAALSLDDYLSDGATGLGRVFPAGANRTVSLDCEPRKPSLL
jgi:F-type H+-transporting ATPase subunit gamma